MRIDIGRAAAAAAAAPERRLLYAITYGGDSPSVRINRQRPTPPGQ